VTPGGTAPSAETLPAPKMPPASAGEGTFPYDGGPAKPLPPPRPMPKAEPSAAPAVPGTIPVEGRMVSITRETSRRVFRAYGAPTTPTRKLPDTELLIRR
jgi:hypothetical protein